MFFRLSINDDFDMWLDYIDKMEPCKIVLRELTKKEMNFITKYDEKLSSTNVLHNIIADD